jgi:hypothetical protein
VQGMRWIIRLVGFLDEDVREVKGGPGVWYFVAPAIVVVLALLVYAALKLWDEGMTLSWTTIVFGRVLIVGIFSVLISTVVYLIKREEKPEGDGKPEIYTDDECDSYLLRYFNAKYHCEVDFFENIADVFAGPGLYGRTPKTMLYTQFARKHDGPRDFFLIVMTMRTDVPIRMLKQHFYINEKVMVDVAHKKFTNLLSDFTFEPTSVQRKTIDDPFYGRSQTLEQEDYDTDDDEPASAPVM